MESWLLLLGAGLLAGAMNALAGGGSFVTLPALIAAGVPWMQSRARLGAGPILVLQFALGVYGGYFGGAVGLMMVAAWGLLADVDLKRLNPPRTLMVSAANTIAVLCFAAAGAVRWRETLVLGAAAIIGGYLGAHLGRRLDPRLVRIATLALSVVMTALFFLRAAR